MRKFLDAQPIIFEPEVIQILAAALDDAWATVQASGALSTIDGHVVNARELLAKHIIRMAEQGERDQRRLSENAIAHLTKLKPQARKQV